MKLKRNIECSALLEALQRCRQDVYLDTAEGDHLNLRSTLSQFVFASVVAAKLPELQAEIICQPEDREILRPFVEE